MTVGELVNEQWTYMDGMEAMCGPKSAIALFQNILSSLGIWDAEVLEGVWDPEGGFTDYDLLQVWGNDKPPAKTAYGPTERVRVIVLPMEEEK